MTVSNTGQCACRVPNRGVSRWPVADTEGNIPFKDKGEHTMATKPFKGVIDVDIRKSTPDWEPYEQPKAPAGAPNVLFIVWDDTGFGALSPFGGPIEVPTMDRLAKGGLRYTPVPHHRALLADPRLAADRPQPHHRRHGLHRRSHHRLPGLERAHPLRDGAHRRSARRKGLQHLHAGQVALLSRGRDQHGLHRSATGPPAAASSATTASWAARPTSGIPTWCRISSSWSSRPSRPRTGRQG